jgi:hypothetical protein
MQAVTYDVFITEFSNVMRESFEEYQRALMEAEQPEEVLELHAEFLMFITTTYSGLIDSIVESRGIIGFKNGHH